MNKYTPRQVIVTIDTEVYLDFLRKLQKGVSLKKHKNFLIFFGFVYKLQNYKKKKN